MFFNTVYPQKKLSYGNQKNVFKVGEVIYGNYEEGEFKTLKDAFNYIRSKK